MRSLGGLSTSTHPLVFDGVLAVVLAVLSVAELVRPLPANSTLKPPDLLGYVLVVALCAPLAWRRRAPRLSLAVMLAVTLGIVAGGYTQSTIGIPMLVAVFSLGWRCDLRRSALPLAGAVAVLVLSGVTDPEPLTVRDLLLVPVSLVAAWWLGAGLRVRAAYARAQEERAELLERARQDLARRAVAEERLRIARELHDVVSHTMSVIAVQSGMAVHVLDTQPERARAALEAIATTSREAMVELRGMLGLLREDGEPAGSLWPAPGLADVETLAAGVPVDFTVSGDRFELPPALDLTAYRIVQEALTNTVKHAGPGATASVAVTYAPDQLVVEVVDHADGTAPEGEPGVGLIGMRERVAAFGGRLDAGPTADGFRVVARLPVPGA